MTVDSDDTVSDGGDTGCESDQVAMTISDGGGTSHNGAWMK